MASRILVVDDERDLVFAVKLYLEAAGYEVIAAYDGAEAIELLEDHANLPDLMMLDVYMPHLSGWDVLSMIRVNKQWCSIPVIMLTVVAQEAEKARGWQSGVDWYQTKPFDPKDLLVVIERLLEAGKTQAAEDAAWSVDTGSR